MNREFLWDSGDTHQDVRLQNSSVIPDSMQPTDKQNIRFATHANIKYLPTRCGGGLPFATHASLRSTSNINIVSLSCSCSAVAEGDLPCSTLGALSREQARPRVQAGPSLAHSHRRQRSQNARETRRQQMSTWFKQRRDQLAKRFSEGLGWAHPHCGRGYWAYIARQAAPQS